MRDRSLSAAMRRRLPVGAELQPGGGAHFRVWAPRCGNLAVEVEGLAPVSLTAEEGGYFTAFVPEAREGMHYWLRAGHSDTPWPDPASRFQPEGPHGPSQL